MSSDLYAAKYVAPGQRPLSPDEITVRQTARELKIADAYAIRIAAPLILRCAYGAQVAVGDHARP